MRDTQFGKVNMAIREMALHPSLKQIPDEATLNKFMERIVTEPWFVNQFGATRVTTKFAKRNADTRCDRYSNINPRSLEIFLPKWARVNIYALKFLAYAMRPRDSTYNGPESCAILIFLTKNSLGESAGAALVRAFITHRVKFKPYPGVHTPEDAIAVMKVKSRVLGKEY